MNQPARQTRTDIANLPPKRRVAALLQQNKNAISQVLPKHISAERLMQVAFTAVRTTPKLLECDSNSLIGGIIQCATLGLEPNTVLGHAYLIPFKKEVQIVIGYKGLIDLARRSGQIVSIAAHVVHEADDFEYQYGLNPVLRHVPFEHGDRGPITHAYAVAHLKDGGNAFEVMPKSDIDAVMLQSQSKGAWGPWKDHYSEMARKTAIRRLSKFLPLSVDFATAVAMDAKSSAGEEQHLDDVLSGEFAVVDQPDPPAAKAPNETGEALKKRLREGDDRPFVDPPEEKPQAAAQGEQESPQEGDTTELFDDEGTEFDPTIHAFDKDTGEPIKNKDGTWRKQPGKKAESSPAGDPADPGPSDDELPL